jgi:hypothetical protein
MAHKFISWIVANRKTVLITFEIFWILVFVMDRMTSTNAVDIPQFVYVNF